MASFVDVFSSNAATFASNLEPAVAFGSNAAAFASNLAAPTAAAFVRNAALFASNLSPAVDFASNMWPSVDFSSNLWPSVDFGSNLAPSVDFGSNAAAFASNLAPAVEMTASNVVTLSNAVAAISASAVRSLTSNVAAGTSADIPASGSLFLVTIVQSGGNLSGAFTNMGLVIKSGTPSSFYYTQISPSPQYMSVPSVAGSTLSWANANGASGSECDVVYTTIA